MIPSSRFISAYLFFSVCALIGYTIMFYVIFFLAVPSGGVLLLINEYGEMWPEVALLVFTGPGILKCLHHLIAHWFV